MPGREADASIAHRHKQGRPTGGPDCVARFAGHAVPHPLDAPKLLGVDVQKVDRRGVLAVDDAHIGRCLAPLGGAALLFLRQRPS